MKRIIALFLTLVLLSATLLSCGTASISETDVTKTEEKKTEVKKTEEKKTEAKPVTEETKTEEEKVTETTPAATEEAPAVSDHMLDGKKVIFVGNSYTYYGNAVINKSASLRKQSQRTGDKGYFYQICKANGAEVEVTNWTFGSHGLTDYFSGCTITKHCTAGYDHTKDLTDAKYDYVFLQERTGEELTAAQVLQNVDKAVAFFRAANPDVKVFFLVQHRVYEWNVGWKTALQDIAARGVTVIEWGAMVQSIIEGKTKVPGATQTYNKNSFIISQSESDGYHPNMLTGYITAQMAYCAITGESAVGQPYSFCLNASVNSAFNPATYIASYYKNGATTNLRQIFASEADMKGLQTLMDSYKAK